MGFFTYKLRGGRGYLKTYLLLLCWPFPYEDKVMQVSRRGLGKALSVSQYDCNAKYSRLKQECDKAAGCIQYSHHGKAGSCGTGFIDSLHAKRLSENFQVAFCLAVDGGRFVPHYFSGSRYPKAT